MPAVSIVLDAVVELLEILRAPLTDEQGVDEAAQAEDRAREILRGPHRAGL